MDPHEEDTAALKRILDDPELTPKQIADLCRERVAKLDAQMNGATGKARRDLGLRLRSARILLRFAQTHRF